MNIFSDSDFADVLTSVTIFVMIGLFTYWAVNKIVPIERPPQIQQNIKGAK